MSFLKKLFRKRLSPEEKVGADYLHQNPAYAGGFSRPEEVEKYRDNLKVEVEPRIKGIVVPKPKEQPNVTVNKLRDNTVVEEVRIVNKRKPNKLRTQEEIQRDDT